VRRLIALALLLEACSGDCKSEDPSGKHFLYSDPEVGLSSFVDHPFPSNALLKTKGIDLRHFPNPTESSTLDDYLKMISEDSLGFGTSAPMYLGFSDEIDPDDLERSIELIDVDPDSSDYGRRFPLSLRWSARRSLYLPKNTVSMLVPFGIPLAPATTYAVTIDRDLKVRAPKWFHNGLRAVCREQTSERLWDVLAPLRAFVEDPDELVGGTVFTTQDALVDLRALASVARALPAPELRNLTARGYSDGFLAFGGDIDLPGFQSGDIPYRAIEDGGAFARDEDGRPMVTHSETTSIAIALPRTTSMPPDGWPVVLYSHGTGGSYRSVLREEAVGDALGKLGIAAIGYDQTLHGPRDPTHSNPELTFFNLFNPVAARDNIRQGTADAVVLTTLIENLVIDTERGEERFDRSRIGFLGHSQGSLTGSLFAAVDERPKVFVFSGLGAILTITLQERKDIVDFEGLLRTLLAFPEDEQLDDFHPVLGLIETFIEPADPIAYARSYLVDPPMNARRDMLIVEGFLDFASPARGQEAFATAARFPVVAPVHRVPEAAMLVGPAPQDAPAKENVDSIAGPVTAGLIQYPEETHYPIFDNADANRRYLEFFRTALMEGRATIAP
jgi:hypothetical protein